MGRRALMLALVALAIAVVMARAPAAESYPNCGFHPVFDHNIDHRRHITCAEAKRVLLQLRGDRKTVPMICGRARWIGGWWVVDPQRLFEAVYNRYKRGRQSFTYYRAQYPPHIICRPPWGSGEAGV
jgi:hypothetical protein